MARITIPVSRAKAGFYLNNSGPRLTEIRAQIQDIGERRIRDMDAMGIAKQILSLTSPGVQVFDAPTAVSLAASRSTISLLKRFASIPTVLRDSRPSLRKTRQPPRENSSEP